ELLDHRRHRGGEADVAAQMHAAELFRARQMLLQRRGADPQYDHGAVVLDGEAVRRVAVAKREIALGQPRFLAAMVENAVPARLQQEGIEPRRAVDDVLAGPLDIAPVRAHAGELDRAEAPERELRGEPLAIGRREIDRVQLARIERVPCGGAGRQRKGVRAIGFHRSLSRRRPSAASLRLDKARSIRPGWQPFLHAPPATGRFAPVTYDAASEARNSTASAISAGSATRCIGTS